MIFFSFCLSPGALRTPRSPVGWSWQPWARLPSGCEPRAGLREPQIRLEDLGQLALQPHPVQPQPHLIPGGQHEPQPLRGRQHHQLQLPQRLRAELVHVVDHQPQRCGSRSPSPAGTHAALPATPAQLIQDRSSTVLPLPGGADTTLTRACAASRPNSRGRPTKPPAPRPAAPPATAPAPATDPIVPIIAPRQPTWPAASCQSLDVRRTTIPRAGLTCRLVLGAHA